MSYLKPKYKGLTGSSVDMRPLDPQTFQTHVCQPQQAAVLDPSSRTLSEHTPGLIKPN